MRLRALPIGSFLLRAFAFLVAVWLVMPILVVIPLSLTDAQSFVFPPESYSFRWFENLFEDPAWRDALWTSARIAVLVVILSVVVGTAAALGLDRGRLPGKGIVRGLLLAPMIVPIIITGVGIYAVFLPMQLIGTDVAFVLSHTVIALPFVVVAVSTSLRGFDRELERASASLGASPVSTFFHVTLPNIAPGMFAGAVFAFVLSFDELVISLFISTPLKKTVPVQMFDSLDSVDPTIAAASTVLLLSTTAVILLAILGLRNVRDQTG
jgi:putative spermidine/putrescine transport system permease protein